jgi:hypothetical protein
MTSRTTARLVGALFIVASAAAIIGGSMVQGVEGGDLAEIADEEALIVTGFLLEIVLVAAVVGIAALLFPVLSRRNEGLALAYVGARIIEATLLLVAAMGALVLVAVARDSAGSVSPSTVVATFVPLRTWTYLVGSMLALGIGALILYWLLYRSRIVPRWLSLWGLAGAALITIRAILEVYGFELDPVVQGAMAAPIAINEMVLAVWLIVKGFDERFLPDPSESDTTRALQTAA